MNHEAQVIYLRRMAAAIHRETTTVHGTGGPGANTVARDELMGKVARWQEQLRLFNRNLDNRAGWVNHTFTVPSRRPSYGEKQSYKSRMNNIASLRNQALAVADSIVELLRALNGPAQALNALAGAIEKLAKGGDDVAISAGDQQDLQQIVAQISVDSTSPHGTGYTPSHTYFTDVFTMCIALFALVKHLRSKGDKAA